MTDEEGGKRNGHTLIITERMVHVEATKTATECDAHVMMLMRCVLNKKVASLSIHIYPFS